MVGVDGALRVTAGLWEEGGEGGVTASEFIDETDLAGGVVIEGEDVAVVVGERCKVSKGRGLEIIDDIEKSLPLLRNMSDLRSFSCTI